MTWMDDTSGEHGPLQPSPEKEAETLALHYNCSHVEEVNERHGEPVLLLAMANEDNPTLAFILMDHEQLERLIPQLEQVAQAMRLEIVRRRGQLN